MSKDMAPDADVNELELDPVQPIVEPAAPKLPRILHTVAEIEAIKRLVILLGTGSGYSPRT
jgi:hypothetical protein